MNDAHGNIIDFKSFQGNNFNNQADQTVSCEGSVGGWQDGYYNVELTSDYQRSQGVIKVIVSNTLD
jgi:hypothetical protein